MNDCAAARVARLLAGQPGGFGGVHLRAASGIARAAWLAHLRALLPTGTPWVRVPAGASADALLGGLDLPATLALGRPVASQGLMARAHGGVLLLSMAERADGQVLACVQQALDQGSVRLERDGLRGESPARFSLLVLDESCGEDEGVPPGLRDRLCFTLERAALEAWYAQQTGVRAQEDGALEESVQAGLDMPGTAVASDPLTLLCTSALQLGIDSLRAPLQAWQVAAALASAQGRSQAAWQDLAQAASLVYAARATQAPGDSASAPTPPPAPADPGAQDSAPPPPPAAVDDECDTPASESPAARPPQAPPGVQAQDPQTARQEAAPDVRLVSSVLASLSPDVLARLAGAGGSRGSGRATRQASPRKGSPVHGRPVGSRRGDPRRGLPLDLLGTLRAALPWQGLRRPPGQGRPRLAIRAGDLRVRRLKPRLRSTAVFAVDASGSAALHRLNEAKGAVASLLAQCYVRRDQVALVSFRGAGARICLPPTRSLARVHRELAALPGGGGTPLAAGLQTAGRMAGALRRRGEAALVVLLTDGRANVALDGTGGRALAEQQALAEAAALRARDVPALLVDIAPQPQARARLLAQAMAARYLALPAASAERLAAAVAQHMPAREARHG